MRLYVARQVFLKFLKMPVKKNVLLVMHLWGKKTPLCSFCHSYDETIKHDVRKLEQYNIKWEKTHRTIKM